MQIGIQVHDACRDVVVHAVEQQQLDRRRALRVHGDVHAVGRERRADRMARARLGGREGFGGLEDGLHRRRLVLLGVAYRPTLACIIPPSTTYVVAVP